MNHDKLCVGGMGAQEERRRPWTDMNPETRGGRGGHPVIMRIKRKNRRKGRREGYAVWEMWHAEVRRKADVH